MADDDGVPKPFDRRTHLVAVSPFAPREWRLAHGRSLTLGARPHVMGILNVTPDSFSDGGRFDTVEAAVAQARAMVEDGATIIDVGGESTRPGAEPVDSVEERRRVLPVVERLAAELDVALSVDTRRADTARLALQRGAHIVNDVGGLQDDSDMVREVARLGAGVCIMHTSRGRTVDPDVVRDQHVYLQRSLDIASDAGVANDRIVLDPGIGFGKDSLMNLALLSRLDELHAFGFPLLVGASRKRFLGGITGREAADRDAATVATSILARIKGASILRVHDVRSNVDALRVSEAVRLI